MASHSHTENPEGFNPPSDDTESLINPAPAAPPIEESLGKALDTARRQFSELVEKVKALPFGHPDRRTHYRLARILGQKVKDTASILDRRHWQEFDDEADLTAVKRRGRPSKAMLAARAKAEAEEGGEG